MRQKQLQKQRRQHQKRQRKQGETATETLPGTSGGDSTTTTRNSSNNNDERYETNGTKQAKHKQTGKYTTQTSNQTKPKTNKTTDRQTDRPHSQNAWRCFQERRSEQICDIRARTTERDYVIPARARPEGLDFFGKFAFFRGVPGRTGHAAEAC